MSDLVEREVVLRCIKESAEDIDWGQSEDGDAFKHYVAAVYRTVAYPGCVPSAQPKQRWIPCSERLPEDGLYIVTTSKGQVQVHVFSHNGNSEEYWMRCNKAWMPLPEPWKGEQPCTTS